jgi:hypothetical protein
VISQERDRIRDVLVARRERDVADVPGELVQEQLVIGGCRDFGKRGFRDGFWHGCPLA